FFGPKQKVLGTEFLGRLRCGIINLPNDTIAFGVNVDAQLDPVGANRGLCFSGLGIGAVFHNIRCSVCFAHPPIPMPSGMSDAIGDKAIAAGSVEKRPRPVSVQDGLPPVWARPGESVRGGSQASP